MRVDDWSMPTYVERPFCRVPRVPQRPLGGAKERGASQASIALMRLSSHLKWRGLRGWWVWLVLGQTGLLESVCISDVFVVWCVVCVACAESFVSEDEWTAAYIKEFGAPPPEAPMIDDETPRPGET